MGTTKIKGEAQVQELYLLADGSRICSGDFTVGDGTGARVLDIDGAADEQRHVGYQSGGVDRWRLLATSEAEGGSNAGSNFTIQSRKDDGQYLANPVKIIRSTGDILLSNDARIAGGLYIGGVGVDPPTGTLQTTGSITAGTALAYSAVIIKGLDASTSDLIFMSSENAAAIIRRNTSDDIVWMRYNPPGTYQDVALTFDSSTGDIFTVPWTDYSTAGTINGWSVLTTREIWYKKIGKFVYVQFALQGTSNLTTISFTLPHAPSTAMGQSVQVCVYGIDNGTPQVLPARLDIPSAGVWFNVYKTLAAEEWYASGTKGIRGEFFYQVA